MCISTIHGGQRVIGLCLSSDSLTAAGIFAGEKAISSGVGVALEAVPDLFGCMTTSTNAFAVEDG
jgi:hypothetical protein